MTNETNTTQQAKTAKQQRQETKAKFPNLRTGRLFKLANYIEQLPKDKYNQFYPGMHRHSNCGCILHYAALSNPETKYTNATDFMINYRESATNWLGITKDQYIGLNYTTNWPKQFKQTQSNEYTAKVAAARIRHMARTGE